MWGTSWAVWSGDHFWMVASVISTSYEEVFHLLQRICKIFIDMFLRFLTNMLGYAMLHFGKLLPCWVMRCSILTCLGFNLNMSNATTQNPNMLVKKGVNMWQEILQILCRKPNNFFLGALNSDATELKCSLNQTASFLPCIHLHWTSPLKYLPLYQLMKKK